MRHVKCCGTENELATALSIIESEGPPRGLFLNRSKSLIYTRANTPISHPLLHDIPTTLNGFILLGSPIGPSTFCEESVSKRIHKVKDTVARLHDLQDSQLETTLLRSCLALPKLVHVLSTCPSSLIPNAIGSFDHMMRDTLSDLAERPLPDWSWLKASLPSSLGRLNLRQASVHASAAYIGSLHQSRHLVAKILRRTALPPIHLPYSLQSLARDACRPDWKFIQDIDVPLSQHSLSWAIDEASFADLLATAANPRSKALALSTSIRHASDCLNVVPSSALGLHLLDREFWLCLQYWLGLQMFEEHPRCPVCHSTSDHFGDHHVGCGGNADRIFWHNYLRDAIFSAAQNAALAPRKEVPSLIPGSQNRPPDVFLPCWKGSRPATLDITVISTMQQLTIRSAAEIQGHALLVAEERKFAAHGAECQLGCWHFLYPLCH